MVGWFSNTEVTEDTEKSNRCDLCVLGVKESF